MVTTEILPRVSLEDLDRAAEWERAAQLLDLEPIVLQNFRQPQLEFHSRHESPAGTATLHGLRSQVTAADGCMAEVIVRSGFAPAELDDVARELQFEAALAGLNCDCAVLGLQLPAGPLNEKAFWLLAHDCAPVASRILYSATLLPIDLTSAVFAGWMANFAAQFRSSLTTPPLSPASYCNRADWVRAQALVMAASHGLEEFGKTLRGGSAAVIGGGSVARRVIEALHARGTKIVVMADESGALVEEGGMEVAALLRHMEAGGLAVEYSGAQHALHSEALAAAADVLVLESEGQEITLENVQRLKAPLVIEGRARVSLQVSRILEQRGATLIPSAVSHCLRLHPRLFSRSSGVGQEELQSGFRTTWREIIALRKLHRLPFETATLVLALQRFAERERSLHP